MDWLVKSTLPPTLILLSVVAACAPATSPVAPVAYIAIGASDSVGVGASVSAMKPRPLRR